MKIVSTLAVAKRTLAIAAALAFTAGPVVADDSALSPQEQQGKRLFNHTCVYCHGPGVWGTNRLAKRFDKERALLENRTDLTAPGIEAVVRNGLGSMPPMRKTELTDSDVAAIAAYLTRQSR
jgi:mono/diheme cytochrome c family protein